MNILLTGSTGFVGHTVAAALTRAGHTVRGGVSPRQRTVLPTQVPMDFARDTAPEVWLPRLVGIDAVVNAVGVLRDSSARPIDAVHHQTPTALFTACAQVGVKRVVHISALGIEGSSTRYASTKRAADAHLLGLAAQGLLSAAVLRPSVVFGKGGDSSALFMNLARLPVALFPGPMLTARVQPVSVHDLAAAIVALLGPALGACRTWSVDSENRPQRGQFLPDLQPHSRAMGQKDGEKWTAEVDLQPTISKSDRLLETQGIIECAGPEALTMGAFIASLRQQLGSRPAHVLRLPDPLTQLSARLGDAVPGVPWCTETLSMLGSDNVGNPAVFEQLLEHQGVHYSQLVATAWR